MTKEQFIQKVNKQRGWIDELDAYRLVSIFTDNFGVIYTELPIEMELLYMWEKLNEVENEKKTKICTNCKIEKELDDFYKDKKSKDGRLPRCARCTREYISEWNVRKRKKINHY